MITGGPPDGTADGASRLLSHPSLSLSHGVDFLSFTPTRLETCVVARGGREMLPRPENCTTHTACGAARARRQGCDDVCVEDADIKSVVDWAMCWHLCTAGQICSATSLWLLVHESIAPQLIDELKQATEKLRVGDPLDEATQMGAVISGECSVAYSIRH